MRVSRCVAMLCLVLTAPAAAVGSEAVVELERVDVDLRDRLSLQRGAALYMNYCLGCHGLRYQRYQRLGEDLGVPDDLIEQHLIFDDSRVGGLIETAMPPAGAVDWFGVEPPDLSLVARARGADWIYNYLRNFYSEPMAPWGVNNRMFPNVGMPFPLLELQGLQHCAPGPSLAPNGGIKRDPLSGEDILDNPCGRFELDPPGELSPAAFDMAVRDLVNFLVYVGEPTALKRYRLGVYVLMFLAAFLVLALLLNREYWKDVS